MQKKPSISTDAAELRRRAEDRLRTGQLAPKPPSSHPKATPEPPASQGIGTPKPPQSHPKATLKPGEPDTAGLQTEADTQRLVHELQVHQIELELQNEEIRQARDRMEVELERYSDLYDFAPVGYVTLDREGAIREANHACASLLGTVRSRLVKQRFGLFVAAADLPAFNGFLQKVFESKARESCEVKLIMEGKNAVEVRIDARAAVSGRECRAVLEDITGRKRAEADRLILSKLESTAILAGGIAHDYNNLLTIILLSLEHGRTLVPAGEELAHHLERAEKATLLAHGLTQQLITFASGGTPIRKVTALSEIIRDSALLALSGSRVRCDFALADDLWPAEVDAVQIGQVVRNIVQNAQEAMPEGGVVSIRAENIVLGPQEEPALPPGDYVRVSIADRGGGIAKEVLPRVFDPYFSTKERATQKGMGLGLTICHAVIKEHGGSIAVESEVGGGTTFDIHIPALRKLSTEEKAPLPAIPARHGRILVMDDEGSVRKALGATLRRMGHEVELVEDGQRVVEVYTTAKEMGHPFDAVILNLTVRAGMGGEETIQELLQADPTVKAIVMSGYANDPVLLEHERHGFKGALAKPFKSAKLQEMLARVMRS